ncbi:DUF177 domain-containing protein [Trinickia sp. LjRoot230]|uniref:DUF177 domain-containing protein n=1 Tax=Trinickia sp. LjRoot230 TaxID=3342288 RepID=UPI003ED00EA3
MSQDVGKHNDERHGAVSAIRPREFDVFEFARSARQAAGAVRLSQLPRMLNEVPADAPERDAVFTWQAEGSTQPELQDDGSEAAQPYLRLAVHGTTWLECQRCLTPFEQAFDVNATYRLVATEEQAEAYPLDDEELDVIVGSQQFDLIDLIEEELLLSLPLVPKHEVCPQVHESLASGAAGELAESDGSADDGEADGEGSESGESDDAGGKPNPFKALEALKRGDGAGGKKH